MKFYRYKILLIATLLLLGANAHKAAAQVVDTLDIMKEFDEFSFRGANPVNPIKDSTKIREHLIGVKWGVGMNNVSFSQDIDTKSYIAPKNFGIYYTFYHSLWESIPLFGIETGLQLSEIGFTSVKYLDPEGTPDRRSIEGKERFQTIMVPLVSQFRIDFWRMRLLINLGCYGAYKLSETYSGVFSETVHDSYKKGGYGLLGGGGIAFIFSPFELHIEGNFMYDLGNLYDKALYYDNVWVSSHATQLSLSVGLFMRIGGSAYVNKSNRPKRW